MRLKPIKGDKGLSESPSKNFMEIYNPNLLLLAMARQYLKKEDTKKFDSGFIQSNAETLHYLCLIGYLQCSDKYMNWDGFYRGFEAREKDIPVVL